MNTLILGLITGVGFGILLQKGRILRYDSQVGALRLKDMTILKFMFSAVLVGMVGVYMLKDTGNAGLLFMPAMLGGNIIGGLLLGAGWALLGYCPGTSFGALGEGRLDALYGIIGMLAGAAVYAEVYPAISRTVLTWGNLGSLTLPGALGINHWIIIPAFVLGGLSLFGWFAKKGI